MVGSLLLASFLKSFFTSYLFVETATKLHEKIMNKILRTPVKFLD